MQLGREGGGTSHTKLKNKDRTGQLHLHASTCKDVDNPPPQTNNDSQCKDLSIPLQLQSHLVDI